MPASSSQRDLPPFNKAFMVVSAAWILLFLTLFLRQTLPNNPSVTRMMVVESLFDVILGTSPNVGEDSTPSGFRFLSQRIPIAGYGLVILFAAWCQGAAIVRILNLQVALHAVERFGIAFGLGLSTFSLVVLVLGIAGQLQPLVLFAPAAAAIGFLLIAALRAPNRPPIRTADRTTPPEEKSRTLQWLLWLAIVPACLWLLLGAMSPPTDFDVREYHLQGPKEWYQAGQITFLSHNVYTSFPFLSEMLSLAGMTFTGDWWTGALVGKFVLACFAPLTSLIVYCIGRRIANHQTGMLAAMIHLTTPWTLRISIIAYAEGALSFYVAATTLCMLAVWRARSPDERRRITFAMGGLAGSAMACKYTGLVSAVLPASVVVLMCLLDRSRSPIKSTERPKWREHCVLCILTAIGVLVTAGPWLMRNLSDTGNPVYPLAWGIFGGTEWSDEIDRRWQVAHSPDEHALTELPRHFLDVAIRNDWTSPLLFALAIPAAFLARSMPALRLVVAMAVWQFFAWWAFTHRIDRFWVPAIPLVSVIAACSRQISSSHAWRRFVICVVFAATMFNLRFCSLPLVGYHAGLQDLDAAKQLVIRRDIRRLNQSLPADARVLMVGEAEVFDCRFSVVYNTVFDESVFEQIMTGEGASETEMLTPQSSGQGHHSLRERQITHVLVNWSEILRYRSPGSYGYSEYVQPGKFRQLVEQGVLRPAQSVLSRSWPQMSEQERDIVESWEEYEYILTDDILATVQLFEVVR